MDKIIELLKDVVAALEKFIAAVEGEQAVVEEPVEEPIEEPIEEPVVEEPVVEEPVIEEPIVEEPVVETPIAEPVDESGDESTPVAEDPIEVVEPEPIVEAPAPTNIDWIVDEILEGKWGSGTKRKENLEAAGYDYDVVQNRVNEILNVVQEVLDRKWGNNDERKQKLEEAGYVYEVIQNQINRQLQKKTIADQILETCPIQAEWMKNYTYNWRNWNPRTIEKSKEYGTCITFVACVLQRLGILQSGQYVWDNGTGFGDGKVYGNNDRMEVIYMNNKPLSELKSKIKPGDIGIVDDNKSGKSGDGGHIFILTGDWDSQGRPIIWDNHSCTRVRKGQTGKYGYDKSRKVLAIIRIREEEKKLKGSYPNELPTTKLVKTNSEVIADAIKWATWIAGDNNFHYGYTNADKTVNAHHNGCYFCGTNKSQKKGMLMPEHTYCCNPFIGAAWAHGGCVPQALKLCQSNKSWAYDSDKGYAASSLFDNLGHPAKSTLKAGDVLCMNTHVAMYIGNGKLVEAGSGDDNVKNSTKWNNSIHVANLTDKRYNSFLRVHRFNSSVNTDTPIRHGEVSKRVALWQAFLDWYFDGKVGSADGIYGDNTLKWTRQFQEEQIGKGEGDGIIGPKTLEVAKKFQK